MTELVTYGAAHGVATLTLDSPHNRNALSRQLVAELYELLDRAAADDEAKVVVIRAEGRTFCSGADLSEAAEDGMEKAAGVLVDLQRRIVTFPKPVVTRLHGNVRAGGIGIVAASDIAISAADATYAFTEVKLGPHPGRDLADRAAADDRPLGSADVPDRRDVRRRGRGGDGPGHHGGARGRPRRRGGAGLRGPGDRAPAGAARDQGAARPAPGGRTSTRTAPTWRS